jgi:hypothetical protein
VYTTAAGVVESETCVSAPRLWLRSRCYDFCEFMLQCQLGSDERRTMMACPKVIWLGFADTHGKEAWTNTQHLI